MRTARRVRRGAYFHNFGDSTIRTDADLNLALMTQPKLREISIDRAMDMDASKDLHDSGCRADLTGGVSRNLLC